MKEEINIDGQYGFLIKEVNGFGLYSLEDSSTEGTMMYIVVTPEGKQERVSYDVDGEIQSLDDIKENTEVDLPTEVLQAIVEDIENELS